MRSGMYRLGHHNRRSWRWIRRLWAAKSGSLTVEALLILPLILLLMALFLRWGLMLQDTLRETAGPVGNAAAGEEKEDSSAFLLGGPPARRIRDVDALVHLGYSIKEKLPGWFSTDGSGELQ